MSGAKIITGLKDAIRFAQGDASRARVTVFDRRDLGPRVVLRNRSTGRVAICPRKPTRASSRLYRPIVFFCILAAPLTLTACAPAQQAQLGAFETKAGSLIASACTDLHGVEANPLLQGGINIGLAAASGATGGVAGAAIGAIKGMGDAYCANGPPAGDTTTIAQQAAWLEGQIVRPLSLAVATP